MSSTDFVQRFVFDKQDARGAIVRLTETCQRIQATHHYPPALAKLINQFALSAVLLRDSLKIDGSVTIQLRTEGAISLLVADCSAQNQVRAISEYEIEELSSDDEINLTQLGKGAVLAITITPDEGERYQGIVPIEHQTMAECLQDYFQRSEQLPTWFALHADDNGGTGVAIHALPAHHLLDIDERQEGFKRLQLLLKTLTTKEALQLSAQDILTRLFHEENCRLFESKEVAFGCQCSTVRSLDALLSIGREDVQALIDERKLEGDNSLTIDCHFCFQRYEYSFEQIETALIVN